MASLFITYWSGSDRSGGNSPGQPVASETRSISGSSAQSGVTPESARLVSITADAAACFLYGADPTAVISSTGTSAYILANERLWIDAKPGQKIAGITA